MYTCVSSYFYLFIWYLRTDLESAKVYCKYIFDMKMHKAGCWLGRHTTIFSFDSQSRVWKFCIPVAHA